MTNDEVRSLRLVKYGGTEATILQLSTVPDRGSRQVLVRCGAAGINGLDWKIREGLLREAMPMDLPITLGLELAGIVVEAVDGSRFPVGTRAMGPLRRFGAYADFVSVDEEVLIATPQALSDVEAAALPVTTLTAWQALRAGGRIDDGQHVLIHGGAGAIGSFAIQFATSLGARVSSTARGAHSHFVRDLGADTVIDYSKESFEALLEQVDIVLDLVGGDVTERSFQILKNGGAVVSTVSPDVARWAGADNRGIFFNMVTDTVELERFANAVAAGNLQSTIAEVVKPEQLPQALDRNRAGHGPGKMVVAFNPSPT